MPPRTSSPNTSKRITRSSRRSVASYRRPRVDPNDNGYLHLAGRGTGACRRMSDMMIASIVVGGLNVVLASVLLFVYRGGYVRTKAPFTLALILFATARSRVRFLGHVVPRGGTTRSGLPDDEPGRLGKVFALPWPYGETGPPKPELSATPPLNLHKPRSLSAGP